MQSQYSFANFSVLNKKAIKYNEKTPNKIETDAMTKKQIGTVNVTTTNVTIT